MVATPPAREIHLADYSIHIERGVLSRIGALIRSVAPAHRYAVVTDSNVGPLYAGEVAAQFDPSTIDVLTVPAGESHKTRETWATLTDRLLTSGYGRDSAIIGLGGGVVGDLAGFLASTFMRGVPIVHLPTTLLAMIDSSIGGKTGVDTPAGKNLVGTFHPPAGVIVEPQVLATLPLREIRSGLAEAIKHGVIASDPYFNRIADAVAELASDGGWKSDSMLALIVPSIEIKADIVSRDEREEGLRKILNFGHTIGHAIELASGYSLLHGEAIAIGMALESQLAERIGVAQAGTAEKVAGMLQRAGLPTDLPSSLGADALLGAMRSDKKARTGKLHFALPQRIGAMAGGETGWTVSVSDDQLREVLA